MKYQKGKKYIKSIDVKPYSNSTKVVITIFGVLFLLLGIIFSLLGIFTKELKFFLFSGIVLIIMGIWFISLISQNNKRVKLSVQNIETVNNDRKEQEEKNKLIKDTIIDTIKQQTIFDNGRVFHGVSGNAIVFSRNSGDIGFFNDSIEGIKILNVKDIKSIRYENTGTKSNPADCSCIFTIKDFDNPFIKITLDYYNDARDTYNEIKQLYSMLKES